MYRTVWLSIFVSVCWMVGWLPMVGWLDGWLVADGWLDGWLVADGWLVGWLVRLSVCLFVVFL